MKGLFGILLTLVSSGSFAQTLRTGLVITDRETTALRSTAIRSRGCEYLKIEICERSLSATKGRELTASIKNCRQFFQGENNAIAVAALADEIRDEHVKGWSKGIAVVAATVLTAGAAEGLFGFAAVHSAWLANVMSFTPLALAGGAVTSSVLALPDFLERVARGSNPFYNGAVIKVLKSSEQDRTTTRLIDVHGLVRQRESVQRSLKLDGMIRTRSGLLCPRAARL